MNSEIYLGKEYREKVLKGVKKVVEPLKMTYGRNYRSIHLPSGFTNDGVNIAQYIFSEDWCEDIGCEIIRKITKIIEKEVKNGTTTTAIISSEIFKQISDINEEFDVQVLKEDFVNIFNLVDEYINESSFIVDDLFKVALDSCRDAEMATFIVNTILKYDDNFNIMSEYSDSYECDFKESTVRSGFKLFDKKGEDIIKSPLVVSCDSFLNTYTTLDGLFGYIRDKDAVIILNDIDPRAYDILRSYISNHNKGIMVFSAVKNPYLSKFKEIYINKGIMLANKELPIIRYYEFESFTKDGIFTAKIDSDVSKEHVEELKTKINNEFDPSKINKINKEINLSLGRTYNIKLKSNEYNSKMQKDRLMDTVNDILSLIKSNNMAVRGGGVAFRDFGRYIEAKANSSIARNILVSALNQPIMTIFNKSYIKENPVDMKTNIGLNATTGLVEDLMISGVITPIKTFKAIIDIIKDVVIEWITVDGAIYCKESEENIYNS